MTGKATANATANANANAYAKLPQNSKLVRPASIAPGIASRTRLSTISMTVILLIPPRGITCSPNLHLLSRTPEALFDLVAARGLRRKYPEGRCAYRVGFETRGEAT